MKNDIYQNPLPFDRTPIPEPIFDEEPSLVEFYWTAWELAWNHVVHCEGAPQTPYMDEGVNLEKIWIWDTCFMVLFCKYAPEQYPGIQSFNNFYLPMHDNVSSPLIIHHPDNPPLFAWIEYEYARFTGDDSRLAWILQEKKYLQKHFEFCENLKPGELLPYSDSPTALCRREKGFEWSGCQSGMDNTSRGRDLYNKILWVDALAQQALSALYITRIARMLGENKTVCEYEEHYNNLKILVNNYYWNETDGFYYDCCSDSITEHVKVKTPAAYWIMLAELCDKYQAKKMVDKLIDPNIFGGQAPLPSVSRDDKDYEPKGRYWRGGIWLPIVYMAVRALEKYGYQKIADDIAYRMIKHQYKTFCEYKPHTIWEAYNPELPLPSTEKENLYMVRPDFCGWSALGPISMFIENVLGFHKVDAFDKRVEWRKYRKGRHGIRRLRFGDIVTDIIGDDETVEVKSSHKFTLVINGTEFLIDAGFQRICLDDCNGSTS